MKKNWEKMLQLALLFVGTYGERFFMFIHTLVRDMNPKLFSFICLSIVFVMITKATIKH